MRIRSARRCAKLTFETLKKLGVVLKRAKYFLVCQGKSISPLPMDNPAVIAGAISERGFSERAGACAPPEQLSLFSAPGLGERSLKPTGEDGVKCLTGQL